VILNPFVKHAAGGVLGSFVIGEHRRPGSPGEMRGSRCTRHRCRRVPTRRDRWRSISFV